MNDRVRSLAEELPEHQSNRGSEFRDITVPERKYMSKLLVIARAQAQAPNADWSNDRFRTAMQRKKEDYMYECASLGVDIREARAIWWSVVYDNAAPHRRSDLV